MYLAYIDESGSTGSLANGGSKSFTLGCLLVRSSRWAETFDAVLGYRRYLREEFGVRLRDEIKANYLLHNGGGFRKLGLSEQARHSVYRGTLRLVAKVDASAFGVVIRKEFLSNGDPHEWAWTFLLQRLERLATTTRAQVLLVHDEGRADDVRRLARKARRAGIAGSAFGGGVVKRPFNRLIDDPVSRNSQQSLFIQVADLVAYAAFRRVYPEPTSRKHSVVPADMWDELGPARMAEVNQRSGGPSPGIVTWPRQPRVP